jgi:hypothetical protein
LQIGWNETRIAPGGRLVEEERVKCKVRELPSDECRDDFDPKSSFESRDCLEDMVEKPQDFVPLDICGLEAEMVFGDSIVWYPPNSRKKI